MWKHLAFLMNTSACIQVSNFSRKAAWDLVMYTPAAKEHIA
jgi:hypothetical protein